MTHPDRIPQLLLHVVICCNRMAIAVGVERDRFLHDFQVQDVVLRQLEVLGEIAKRIRDEDPDFLANNGLSELGRAIGMRNRIAHQYEGVDLNLAWSVATIRVPRLRMLTVPVLLQLDPGADLDSLHF